MKKAKWLLIVIVLAGLLVVMTACGFFGKKTDGKVSLTSDMISFGYSDNIAYVYTGEPILFDPSYFTIIVDGEYVSYDYFDFTFKDNVNPGVATIVVTARGDNPIAKGSAEVHFKIVADASYHFDGTDFAELNARLADPNILAVQVWNHITVPEGETLVVPKHATLSLAMGYRLNVYGTLRNEGTIRVAPARLSTGGLRESEVYNYGAIENTGTITFDRTTVLNDNGVIRSTTDITSAGVLYLRDEIPSFMKPTADASVHVRKLLTAADVQIGESGRTCYKNATLYLPSVQIGGGYSDTYSLEFSDNFGAGTAKVKVSVNEKNTAYYGEVTVPFEIYRGTVTAEDAAELILLSESGNFDRYQMDSLTLGSEQTFTLRADESLEIRLGMSVEGSLVNRGSISCRQFAVASTGTFENEGSLKTTDTFSIGGVFRNGAGDIDSTKQITVVQGGVFRNVGTLDLTERLIVYGTLENLAGGDLTLSSTPILYGALENAGAMYFASGLNAYDLSSVHNAVGGAILFEDNVVFSSLSMQNDGAIVNKGRITGLAHRAYTSSGTFDNSQGCVWSFVPLEGIEENFVLRRNLGSEGAVFAAAYSETYYNEEQQIPTFTVNGEPLNRGEYHVTCRYPDNDKLTTFSRVGTIEMTVSISTNYCEYAGSIKHTYSILRATTHVASPSAFVKCAGDEGYDRIVLDCDIEIVRGVSRSILPTCTLALNGHRLVVNGTFSLYGVLLSETPLETPFTPTEEGAAIVVGENGYLRNYGRVVNAGLFYVKGAGMFSANATDVNFTSYGAVENDGVIYTNRFLNWTGEGTVHVRKDLGELTGKFTVPHGVYDESAQCPVPTFVDQGQTIDLSRFTLNYALNVDATQNALLTVKVLDLFDPDYYGQGTVHFTIDRGVKEVSSGAEIALAAANVNYQTIRFTRNITLSESVTLSDAQTIDFGAYELSFNSDGALHYGKNCRLVLLAGDETRFLKYVYAADEITLTADIGTAGSKTVLDFKGYAVAHISGMNYLSTVVHMDGYSFVGGIELVNGQIENFAFTFENSSENVSTIGSAVGDYAFVYGTCYEETYVTMRNLTVYGVRHNGGSGTAQVVDLSAENCTFLAARDVQSDYAFRIWTSMTASGTFTNCTFDGANGFYVNRGYEYDHDNSRVLPAYFFYGCTFRAYGPSDKTDFYGNAFILDRNKSNLNVEIHGSHFYSQNGNCIRVTNRTGVYLSVDSGSTFDHPEGKSNILG